MAGRAETSVVYAAGVAQGIALVTFPAASRVLTDPSEYDLSNTQYGTLFVPHDDPERADGSCSASAGCCSAGR